MPKPRPRRRRLGGQRTEPSAWRRSTRCWRSRRTRACGHTASLDWSPTTRQASCAIRPCDRIGGPQIESSALDLHHVAVGLDLVLGVDLCLVLAAAAVELVLLAVGGVDLVLAACGLDLVLALAGVDLVLAPAAGDLVLSSGALELVLSAAAGQLVLAGAAVHLVVAAPAGELILAGVTGHRVVAVIAGQAVVSAQALEGVVAGGAGSRRGRRCRSASRRPRCR